MWNSFRYHPYVARLGNYIRNLGPAMCVTIGLTQFYCFYLLTSGNSRLVLEFAASDSTTEALLSKLGLAGALVLPFVMFGISLHPMYKTLPTAIRLAILFGVSATSFLFGLRLWQVFAKAETFLSGPVTAITDIVDSGPGWLIRYVFTPEERNDLITRFINTKYSSPEIQEELLKHTSAYAEQFLPGTGSSVEATIHEAALRVVPPTPLPTPTPVTSWMDSAQAALVITRDWVVAHPGLSAAILLTLAATGYGFYYWYATAAAAIPPASPGIAAISDGAAGLASVVNQQGVAVTQLRAEIAVVTTSLAEVTARLNALKGIHATSSGETVAHLASIDSKLRTLTNSLTTVNSSVSHLEAEHAVTNDQVTQLIRGFAATTRSTAELSEKLDLIPASLMVFRRHLQEVEQTNTELQQELDTAAATIEKLCYHVRRTGSIINDLRRGAIDKEAFLKFMESLAEL